MSYSRGWEQNKYHWRSPRSKEPRRSIANNHRLQKPNEQKFFETHSKLIHRVVIDLTKRGYHDSIEKLRGIINAFRPIHTPYPIIEIELVTRTEGRNPLEKSIKGFILKSNVYFIGVDNGNLYEFGLIDVYPPPHRYFLDSTFLNFTESYSAMGNLVGLVVGYKQLNEAIVRIANDRGRLSPGHPILMAWRPYLFVIIVMICEGVRFKPLFHIFNLAISNRSEVTINEQMKIFIHNFAKMTKTAQGKMTDNAKSKFARTVYQFPPGLFGSATDTIEAMIENEVFCQQSLGVLNRRKIGFEGKEIDDGFKKKKGAKRGKKYRKSKKHT